MRIYPLNLSSSNCCLQIRQSIVVPNFFMEKSTIFSKTQISKRAQPLSKFRIICYNHAAFPGCNDFVGIKAETSHISESADATSADFCAVRLSSILDDKQTMSLCPRNKASHIDRMTKHMYGHYGPRLGGKLALYLVEVHAPGLRITIDENGCTIRFEDRNCTRNDCPRRHDNLGTVLQLQCGNCDLKCCSATTHCYAIFCAAI